MSELVNCNVFDRKSILFHQSTYMFMAYVLRVLYLHSCVVTSISNEVQQQYSSMLDTEEGLLDSTGLSSPRRRES